MAQARRYDTKLPELKRMLEERMGMRQVQKKYPPCFISYCWANSHQAIALGSK